MVAARRRPISRIWIALALAGTVLASIGLSAPAFAQSDPEVRIKKLEAEVRALQRKVFPGSDGKYFEAEIARPATAVTAPATVTTGPVNDLMGRIDAVEGALTRITAQSEENANRMGKLEARLAALEGGTSAAAVLLPSPSPSTGAPAATTPKPTSITGSLAANTAAMASPTAAKPSPARLAAVAAIERPVSGDKAEDDYLYGYRLWEAKFYPEAAQQLKATVDKYPKGKRISYTRNLLGRAYLDDGKPGTAAQVFLQNYQADKAGDRAADSLLYLGVAMIRLKETSKACMALAEFADVYAAEAAGRLANQYANAKSAVKCN